MAYRKPRKGVSKRTRTPRLKPSPPTEAQPLPLPARWTPEGIARVIESTRAPLEGIAAIVKAFPWGRILTLFALLWLASTGTPVAPAPPFGALRMPPCMATSASEQGKP